MDKPTAEEVVQLGTHENSRLLKSIRRLGEIDQGWLQIGLADMRTRVSRSSLFIPFGFICGFSQWYSYNHIMPLLYLFLFPSLVFVLRQRQHANSIHVSKTILFGAILGIDIRAANRYSTLDCWCAFRLTLGIPQFIVISRMNIMIFLTVIQPFFATAGVVFPFSDTQFLSFYSSRWSPDHNFVDVWWVASWPFWGNSLTLTASSFVSHLLRPRRIFWWKFTTCTWLGFNFHRLFWGSRFFFGNLGPMDDTKSNFPRLRRCTLYGPCKSFPACTPWALRFSPLQHGSNHLSTEWVAAACGLLDARFQPTAGFNGPEKWTRTNMDGVITWKYGCVWK